MILGKCYCAGSWPRFGTCSIIFDAFQELTADVETSLNELEESVLSDIPSKRLLALRTAEANLKMVDMEMGNITLPVTSFKLQVV